MALHVTLNYNLSPCKFFIMQQVEIISLFILIFFSAIGIFWAIDAESHRKLHGHKIKKEDYEVIYPVLIYLEERLPKIPYGSVYGIKLVLEFTECVENFKDSGQPEYFYESLQKCKIKYKRFRSRMSIVLDDKSWITGEITLDSESTEKLPSTIRGEYSNNIYHLNHKQNRCSCFASSVNERIIHFIPESSPYFFCRHFVAAYQEATDYKFLKLLEEKSPPLSKILREPFRQHYYELCDEVISENSSEERPIQLVIGLSLENPWIDIIMVSHDEYEESFGYNVFEKRWSYGSSPRGISKRVKAILTKRLGFKVP